MSQNGDRAQVLYLIQRRLGGCGYIKRNGRRDNALGFVIRRREDLLNQVIPFFERSPLLSSKQVEFNKFSTIVTGMAAGLHRTPEGFHELLRLAVSMNGNGRFRREKWLEVICSDPESSETVRQTG